MKKETEILLKEEWIPYKKHIRKVVEAATVYERNNFDQHRKALRVLVEYPTTKISNAPQTLALGGILFILGCVVTAYIFLI